MPTPNPTPPHPNPDYYSGCQMKERSSIDRDTLYVVRENLQFNPQHILEYVCLRMREHAHGYFFEFPMPLYVKLSS